MDTSDALASIAVLISLFSLGVSIHAVLRDKPLLSITARSGMVLITPGEPVPETRNIGITIYNRGLRPTTILNIGFKVYSSRIHYLMGLAQKEELLIPNNLLGEQLPAALSTGDYLQYHASQERLLEKVGQKVILVVQVHHSFSPHPEFKKLEGWPPENKPH
ncbi:hypothetical protein [Euryhalocaulis caribicus]|uniref:hypothetical protein n=1 Tax=Euryhalocaulis caribicus TaxID=1161401 RepID=UPI001267FBAA|nr:hypothetical protein [Euryhalocaulis caribicus]